ncbi:hypothetical protein N7468_005813 [Penicillium chermesinum]|uniref:Acetyltransferase n=1 Tax=Penicillium chermesinum TaxID=63820 RepID=A0A9W9P2C3_9EURO|nr:uncharacterized protein N7468_005813 [Penicillium chermesinum]KAJ5232857.1 hypothetical protein N7468_005813 [Penicillium chermesinum]
MSAVELATPADAPHLTEIFLAAFSNAFNRRLFPPTAEVREWFAANVLNGTGTAPENEIVVKIADPTTGELAGFAKWVRVAGATGGDRKGQKLSWPESSDRALCDLFFGTMEKDHARIMGGEGALL